MFDWPARMNTFRGGCGAVPVVVPEDSSEGAEVFCAALLSRTVTV
ncbi:hypothetical protein Hhel01_04285 [Haloferula helveola]